jgi:hypothetical protein
MRNLAYWLRNPLDADSLKVLRRIEWGTFRGRTPNEKFNAAYLIARGCVKWPRQRALVVTDKGKDALEFFKGVGR